MYVVFSEIHKNVVKQSFLVEQNWDMTQKINNNILLLNTMLLLNQTDSKTTNYIKNLDEKFQSNTLSELKYSKEKTYLEQQIHQILGSIKNLMKLDMLNPSSDRIMLYHKSYITCNLVYYKYKDSLFAEMQKKYEENNLIPSAYDKKNANYTNYLINNKRINKTKTSSCCCE